MVKGGLACVNPGVQGKTRGMTHTYGSGISGVDTGLEQVPGQPELDENLSQQIKETNKHKAPTGSSGVER